MIMAKHIHIHVGKTKDASPSMEKARATVVAQELQSILRGKLGALADDAEDAGIRKAANGAYDNVSDAVRLLSSAQPGRDSKDATNHLGEKEYYTYRRWKEAVKAAYPNARFEGDQDMCNAVPGGEWDGEKGVVYAKKTGDAKYTARELTATAEKSAFNEGYRAKVTRSGSLVWLSQFSWETEQMAKEAAQYNIDHYISNGLEPRSKPPVGKTVDAGDIQSATAKARQALQDASQALDSLADAYGDANQLTMKVVMRQHRDKVDNIRRALT